ncbi:MAG TPA: tetratricopeptide repeat protein [Thermoanaerobaculia bacterium]|nr:tetratricopeptide repeat protein [Thermoanaerobaculia bacterium]
MWSTVAAGGEPLGERDYDEAIERVLAFASGEEKRFAMERLRGWAQWAELEPLAPEARFLRVEADPSCHTVGLYGRLLEASRWFMRREPAEAVDIVRLAILVAERLDTASMGAERIADLQAAAWAALGNVLRLASDFEGSRHAFNEAWRILEGGTGDPLEEANLLCLEAGYIRDMGEFETAETALEEALKLYEEVGDAHLQGRTLLKMGDAIGDIHPERALTHIRLGLALIDASKEPRLDLCAQHDLALYLNESGQPEEALAVLDRARPLYRQFPDEWAQLRLHWLEGKIARNLGDLAGAESIFQQLWEELRSRNLNHELVLVSIDLAEVLFRQGEPGRVAELLKQCYPIMVSWGLHRYALAAWLVFEDAVANQRASRVFEQIREYYRRHWVNPAAFEPDAI